MKKVIYLFVGLLTLMFVSTSCESSDDPVVEPVAQLGEVTFNVENFITDLQAKDGKLYESILCNDTETPDFVYVKINGTGYELKIITLQTNDGKMQTEVLKLTPGDYTIEEFAVYSGTPNNNDDSDDTVLFASPEHASDYVTNWGMIGVGQGSTAFTVEAFKKDPVAVDVLCYVPSSYEEFGFTWFQFDKFRSKKIYFFGDVCTKFWEQWRDATGSPYANTITGYDFVANFKVDVYLGANDGTPNVTGIYDAANPPVDTEGTTQPLCIEYVDNVQSINETYTFVISLQYPDGSYGEVHSGTFTDLNWSADPVVIDLDGNTLNFGGTDGVFDFVVGNCSYDGNDANIELPAFIPIPKTVTFKYNSGDATYSELEILTATSLPAIASEINAGDLLDAWCGNRDLPIYEDTAVVRRNYAEYSEYEYQADVYSTLDITAMPTIYENYGKAWNVLNWLLNEKEIYSDAPGSFVATHGKLNVQKLIWTIIKRTKEADLDQTVLNAMLADLGVVEADMASEFSGVSFDAIRDYQPTVGDFALVILDPFMVTVDHLELKRYRCGWRVVEDWELDVYGNFQLMVVQVDP